MRARDIFTILLGAILGGSALTAIGPALADPGHIYITIGEALSKSSNFFINYITVQARPAERLAHHEHSYSSVSTPQSPQASLSAPLRKSTSSFNAWGSAGGCGDGPACEVVQGFLMLPFRLFWPNRYPLVTIFRIFHLARCEGPAPFLARGIPHIAYSMVRCNRRNCRHFYAK